MDSISGHQGTYCREEVRVVLHRVLVYFFVVVPKNVQSKQTVLSLVVKGLELVEVKGNGIAVVEVCIILFGE